MQIIKVVAVLIFTVLLYVIPRAIGKMETEMMRKASTVDHGDDYWEEKQKKNTATLMNSAMLGIVVVGIITSQYVI